MRTHHLFLLVTAFVAGLAVAGPKEDIRAHMEAGRWSAADQGLVKVLKEHPNNAQAHYWMAEVKEREGQLAAAREHLAQARSLKPDLSFATNPLMVEELERRLKAGGNLAAAAHPAAAAAEKSHSGISWGLIAVIVALIAAIGFWFHRMTTRTAATDDRGRYRDALKQLEPELRDAEKAIDARADWTAEQRFAYAERVAQAQGDVAKAHYALPTATDFSGIDTLILRVRDLTAEIRGEEKPSEREARLRLAHAQQQAAPGSAGPQTVVVESGGGGAGGLLTGMMLGGMMANSGHAHAQHLDEGYQRLDTTGTGPADGGLSTLDFGRDDPKEDWKDSSADFDSGPDTTTDSGNDDNW